MKYKWSDFLVYHKTSDGAILKNTFTGGVVYIDKKEPQETNEWLNNQKVYLKPDYFNILVDNSFLIPKNKNEFKEWKEMFLHARNDLAQVFNLYFLPTLQCQLSCFYCVEKGACCIEDMNIKILAKTVNWFKKYLEINTEVNSLRFVVFGGEPLLRKDMIFEALSYFNRIAKMRGMDFWMEIITNGEFLDEKTAYILSGYNWKRAQITIDSSQRIHDARRTGKEKHPTFNNIISNIIMLINNNYIEKVDLRLTFDTVTADSIPKLLYFLAKLKIQKRLNLSIGLITSTLNTNLRHIPNKTAAKKIIDIWSTAKTLGFSIPEDFITGPWCVAIAKHSAVIQPNGTMQKCFCTVGRREYNFDSVIKIPHHYTQDSRFEFFDKRIEYCIKEKCPYLPMCGGGCIHDSLVAFGFPDGFQKRFCQKILLAEINKGLLLLNYS